MKHIATLLGSMVLMGCQAVDSLSGKHDPKDRWWGLGYTEPYYMKVWVEDSAVVDRNGRLFQRTGGGTAAGGEFEDGTESARGWGLVGSSSRPVTGADLPVRIFVRWQSVVEPQTYRGWVEIPESARQLMHRSTHRRCPDTPNEEARYMASVQIGLAPGGIMQVWVRDECHRPVKVARAQAEVEPLGPDQGRSEGRYAYTISEESRRYIERFGIPYGSW